MKLKNKNGIGRRRKPGEVGASAWGWEKQVPGVFTPDQRGGKRAGDDVETRGGPGRRLFGFSLFSPGARVRRIFALGLFTGGDLDGAGALAGFDFRLVGGILVFLNCGRPRPKLFFHSLGGFSV